ncbi:MAG: TIGR02449 family protein [Pseudomonadota bacterium]
MGAEIPPSTTLEALESRVEQLITVCDRLREENQALKNQQANLMGERAALIERSELARSRVEAMIARLKAMETT